jgi:hypothetical protein
VESLLLLLEAGVDKVVLVFELIVELVEPTVVFVASLIVLLAVGDVES